MTDTGHQDSPPTVAQLLAQGWVRAFIADEPRLSEASQTYQELGFEVRLLPVPLDGGGCTECMGRDPGRFRLIMTRRRGDHEAHR